MSCLNLSPRSATIIAKTDCKMLEMLRNIYEILLRTEAFKQQMHDIYRQRALMMYFDNLSFLEGMSKEDLGRLRDQVELVMFEPGQIICAEGDEADAMYIIRLGQVKVSHHAAGGERTLAYMTKGDVFGEIGLLRGNVCNAACAAVDHPMVDGGRKRRSGPVELVKISREVFNWVIEKYPRVKGRLEQLAGERISQRQNVDSATAPLLQSRQVESLGLLQGQNLMLIDLNLCTRCDQCVDACVTAHDDGVTRLIREGPRYDRFLVPSSCRQCRDPVCMIGCPVASIRRTPSLNIMIEDWCIGCGICAKQCPYDAIQMHNISAFEESGEDDGSDSDVTQRAAVCDQCSHLPTGPACVYSCPHDAALRVDAIDFLSKGEA
jgi:Fe-S-cluster-containing hydrogenase component 2